MHSTMSDDGDDDDDAENYSQTDHEEICLANPATYHDILSILVRGRNHCKWRRAALC